MASKVIENFSFLSPRLTIKINHLTKSDVNKIKNSLASKIAAAALLIAIGFLLVCIGILVSLGNASNWDYIGVYGLSSLLGQIVGASGSLVAIILEIFALKIKNKNKKSILARLVVDVLYVAIAFNLLASFYADAEMGFLSSSPTMTVSVILIAIILVFQPVYWTEAIILDFSLMGTIIFYAIYLQYLFNIQSTFYYIAIAIIFPLMAYIVVSILFYAETQKYIQDLRNEALYNTALYDELTHCKNRFALREFLSENSKRWENRETNVLLIMFDIDNFKEYNDTFSHQGGDYCLLAITEALRKAFPSPDLNFFRYGGEEFLIFFEPENQKEASLIMEKTRKTVQSLKIDAAQGAPNKYVTISVGGVFVRTVGSFNFEEQLKFADEYLYQAKHSGKNTCVINGSEIN